jgi:hypothetical protein
VGISQGREDEHVGERVEVGQELRFHEAGKHYPGDRGSLSAIMSFVNPVADQQKADFRVAGAQPPVGVQQVVEALAAPETTHVEKDAPAQAQPVPPLLTSIRGQISCAAVARH